MRQFGRRWGIGGGVAAVMTVLGGCQPYRDDVDLSHAVQQTWDLADIAFGEIAQFEGVVWDPDHAILVRHLIIEDALVDGRTVLNIDSGTGLTAIVCLQNGATKVVAADINPIAVANTRYNAAKLEVDDQLDCRLIADGSMSALTVLQAGERFDVILAFWLGGGDDEDEQPEASLAGQVMRQTRLIEQASDHLNVGGRTLFTCGDVPSFQSLLLRCEELGYKTVVLGDNETGELAANPGPGMVVEVRFPAK